MKSFRYHSKSDIHINRMRETIVDVEETDKPTSFVFLFLVQGEGEFWIMNEFRFQLRLSSSLITRTERAHYEQQVRGEGINSIHSFEVQHRVTSSASQSPLWVYQSSSQSATALMLSITHLLVTLDSTIHFNYKNYSSNIEHGFDVTGYRSSRLHCFSWREAKRSQPKLRACWWSRIRISIRISHRISQHIRQSIRSWIGWLRRTLRC